MSTVTTILCSRIARARCRTGSPTSAITTISPACANGPSNARTTNDGVGEAWWRARAAMTYSHHTATDPNFSAWVSANAGAGKTYLLTDRVTRLLLAGSHPS